MSKISELPVATTVTSNDSLIVSNSSSGTRRIKPSDLYNAMKTNENTTCVTVTDANAANSNNVVYLIDSDGLNHPNPSQASAFNIIVIGDGESYMQIAYTRTGPASFGNIYQRNCRNGVFSYWTPISNKYVDSSNSKTFNINLYWLTNSKGSYTKGLLYTASPSSAFLYIVSITIANGMSATPQVTLYKVYDSNSNGTMTGSFANGTLTINYSSVITGGIVLDLEPLRG